MIIGDESDSQEGSEHFTLTSLHHQASHISSRILTNHYLQQTTTWTTMVTSMGWWQLQTVRTAVVTMSATATATAKTKHKMPESATCLDTTHCSVVLQFIQFIHCVCFARERVLSIRGRSL